MDIKASPWVNRIWAFEVPQPHREAYSRLKNRCRLKKLHQIYLIYILNKLLLICFLRYNFNAPGMYPSPN